MSRSTAVLSLLNRRQRKWVTLLIIVLSVVISYGQSQGWFDSITQTAVTSQPGLYTISRYVDGDTIVVDMNGTDEIIRFVGIDTPETHKPNTPVQCYGPAAAAATKNYIANAGGKVRLGSDPESTNRDRYDRLLRYVYLPDGTLLNQKLIEQGDAFYYPYFPFTKMVDFEKAEKSAMAVKKGLWGNCTPTPTDQGGYKMEELAG